ncbi:dTDP-4-amino-4,6-dideoxygalactose transaminase [Vibrio splendidus]|uniref:dTDP-4-amino-4,6-dideoxygalactose transaminase n=1 Tax=Vibrio splendidus TaxID=29497 RepID=UPI000C8652A1|nr:dTDP-4-amino-4,6-dideoxygalactose transaminase [Vibrio splendidus]PMI50803.1 dTDP-4-amino-4,6-dideoxygalactose transaminase [Vibrio splendidus]
MNKIPFNKSSVTGFEIEYIRQAIESKALSGDGYFSKKCENILEVQTSTQKALLVPSCTAALEFSALLIDVQPGDEIIVPSYTFVSTANAFALRGAKLVFVDVEPETMNISPSAIEQAITSKTKAIVPVHYAGVACKMDEIMALANEHGLYVIEDAAQSIGNNYKGKPLGSIGHFGTFSFHETKNITSGGEGGVLLINDQRFVEKAEIIREKGTNRKLFLRGAVDKYSWVDIGSSFLPSEIQCAYLFAQLENLQEINGRRLELWNIYKSKLQSLENEGIVTLPFVPEYSSNNAHMFYLKCQSIDERSALIEYLNEQNIMAAFHYVPLHTSKCGKELGEFCGEDVYTTMESERLVRLPLFYELRDDEVLTICGHVNDFLKANPAIIAYK